MQYFPNPLERTAASALLLLSTGEEEKNVSKERRISSVSKYTNSSHSSSISNASADRSDEVLAHRLNVIAVVARCHEFKLKVVKKARSKINHIADHQKIVSVKGEAISYGSVSMEPSCLSSTSSAASSAARSLHVRKVKTELDVEGVASWAKRMKQERVGPAHLQRRADAILRLLAGECASEARIRQVLGNSPDTSKALRMLLRMDEVTRFGVGGRHDPYVYMIA